MSGEILPHVFLCMQEPSGKFGPHVQIKMDEITKDYKNVIITCSKSGKLTQEIYQIFLKSILQPYVSREKFLLLIDSWKGQTKSQMYDELLVTDEGNVTFTVKIIPPKCTALVQPCDVYFYRQIKIFLKKTQNCSYLIEHEREITSREDCIKLHVGSKRFQVNF